MTAALPMISNRDLRVCAQEVIRQHGKVADEHVAKRVMQSAKIGGDEGVRI